MNKYISIVVILLVFLNINLTSFAYSDENNGIQKIVYQYDINDNYKKSFLTDNNANLNFVVQVNDVDENEPINPNWIVLNLLFPGLGNFAVGEFIGGTILFVLALIPIIFFTAILKPEGGGNVGYSLSVLFIGVPSFLVIYIINLFVTNSMHSNLSKKYKRYKKINNLQTELYNDFKILS